MSLIEIPLIGIVSNIAIIIIVGMSLGLITGLFVFIFGGKIYDADIIHSLKFEKNEAILSNAKYFIINKLRDETFISLFFGCFVKYIAMGLIHEMGHLLMSLILGFKAQMGWNIWGLFTYNFTKTMWDTFIVAASGALCIPFAYYFMMEEEEGDRVEWKIAIATMFLYSIVEVLYFVFI